MNKIRSAQDIQKDWDSNPRWKNVKRDYSADEVAKLSGSVNIEYSLAKQGAEKLWNEINNSDFVNALGALTGNQAMQQAKAVLGLFICLVGRLQEMQILGCKCIQINLYTQ